MREPHKIVKQTLDIQVLENKDVYNLQSKVRDVYYEQLLPILDAHFDEIAPVGTTVVIDRLEINLGAISAHSLDFDLKQELELVIAEYVHPIKNAIQSGQKQGELKVRSGTEKIQWSLEPVQKQALEGLIVFLRTGVMPWGVYKSLEEQSDVPKGAEGLIQLCLEKYAHQLAAFIKKNHANRSIQQRVFHHFSEAQILELLLMANKSILNWKQEELESLLQEIIAVSGSQVMVSDVAKRAIWWHVFVALEQVRLNKEYALIPAIAWALKSEGQTFFSLNQVLRRWATASAALPTLRKQLEIMGVPVTSILKQIPIIESRETTKKPVSAEEKALVNTLKERKNVLLNKQVFASEFSAFISDWQQLVEQLRSEGVISEEAIQRFRKNREEMNISVKRIQEAPEEEEESAQEEFKKALEEGIAVNNAGLVILAMYVPFLFDYLGWLDEERKILPNALEKALAMTHYLVYNDETTDESQLALNKVILGIDPEEPIVNNYQLSEEEKIEGVDLLETVIKRWEAVGSGTTPGGLQISFLQRSGLLYLKDDQYLLRVERKTLDILLDRIPWTISTVKLNWMDNILITEW